MDKKYILLTFLFIFVFIGGFLVGKMAGGSNEIDWNSSEFYSKCWSTAKERISQTGYFDKKNYEKEIKSVSGTIIKDVAGKKITVQILPLSPLASPELNMREITVNSNTEILKIVKKDNAQYEKELKDFKADNVVSAITPDGPSPYTEKKINVSELKNGDRLIVYSDSDIKETKRFSAGKIIVQQ
jgi:hypothetical protein